MACLARATSSSECLPPPLQIFVYNVLTILESDFDVHVLPSFLLMLLGAVRGLEPRRVRVTTPGTWPTATAQGLPPRQWLKT